MPARPHVLSIAQRVEVAAEREGAGVRARELHLLAARLVARMWRVEQMEQDAKEAEHLYALAAQDPKLAPACEAAVERALLAGEHARDPATTYVELHRAKRIFEAVRHAGCVARIDAHLAAARAFRPEARVLAAIDQGLAGQGWGTMPAAAPREVIPRAERPAFVRIEKWPGTEAFRAVMVLSGPAKYEVRDEMAGTARTPRTVIEVEAEAGEHTKDEPLAGIVTRYAAERSAKGTRVSFDLSGRGYRRVFHLAEPYRIVVDIAEHPPGASRSGRSVSRIVLDPGHGGSDPGAIGPSGVREKDVTLDVARRAAPLLAKQGMQVLLTRDDDRFIPLEERTARANAYSADLFVSIHCNAADNKARHGVETYVLDTHKDDIAARVAARENATTTAANAELGAILSSMRMADQGTRSGRLAELMQRSAMASLREKWSDVSDGGVHSAGFYVLVGARMPSVLFETSYISNAGEEERLGQAEYKQRLADAVANAIRAYREGR